MTVNHAPPVSSCQLLNSAGPGTGDPDHDTYTRVPGTINFDWSGTYAATPPGEKYEPAVVLPQTAIASLQTMHGPPRF